MTPAVIGGYRVLELVGQGAMGTVYRCRDETLERDVAVKVMSAAQSAEPAARTRFVREARAAARLQHPNIVTIYQLHEEGDLPFIVMEYLEGLDLQRAIAAGIRPNPSVTLPIVLQILAGLGHAHEHGIVHRDVKPSNIFLPRGRPAKITDFGVARLTGGTTTAGVLVGTPNYMSPEQVVGGAVDGRSDLFSTGLILYELVTGERAYAGDSVVAILYRIANERPDLSLLPPAPEWACLRRVITRALAQDPSERYPDAHVMAKELSQALTDLGGSLDWASASDRGLLVRHTVRAPRMPSAPSPARLPEVPLEPQATAETVRALPWRRLVLALAGLSVAILAIVVIIGPPGSKRSDEASGPTASPVPSAPARPSPTPAQSARLARTPPLALPALAATPLPAVPPPVPTPAAAAPTASPTVAPVNSSRRLERANALLDAGRYQAALNEARSILARDAANEEARAIADDAACALAVEERLRKARAALSRGERVQALSEVQAGLVLAPNDARLLALYRQLAR